MDRCGFEDGVNYISIKRTDNYKKARKYLVRKLVDEMERMEIAENAYDLILERHTTECRIKEFLEVVNES